MAHGDINLKGGIIMSIQYVNDKIIQFFTAITTNIAYGIAFGCIIIIIALSKPLISSFREWYSNRRLRAKTQG